MKVTSPLRCLVVTLLTLFALACDGDKPAPKLGLAPAEKKLANANAEAERLHKMQLITVVNQSDGGIREMSDGEFYGFVTGACGSSDTCNAAPTCRMACEAQVVTCYAQSFLAFLRPQGAMVPLGSTGYLVPEQPQEAKQKLAALGRSMAHNAADHYYQILRAAAGLTSTVEPGTCSNGGVAFPAPTEGPSPPSPAVSLASFAATGLSQAYEIYQQLVDAEVSASVSSADAELNSATSVALGAQRSLTQRLTAARALGGDTQELPEEFNGGTFCSRAPATPAVRAAIAVIRDAAPSPSDVLSDGTNGTQTISTQDLIEGINGVVPEGSVRQRLANFYFGTLDTATGATPVLPSGKSVEGQYDIDIKTFDEARSYLKEELVAFARSKTAVLTQRTDPNGNLAQYKSYAATGTNPSRLPSAYYGALARQNNAYNPTNGQGTWDQPVFPDVPTFSDDYNLSFQRFFSAAGTILAANGVNNTIGPSALGTLGLLVSSHDLLGVFSDQQLLDRTDGKAWRITVMGFAKADGVKLAVGEDDLRCAVQGSIEGGSKTAGSACSLSTLVALDDTSPFSGSPFTKAVTGDVPGGQRIYLLRPRQGMTSNSDGSALPPGSYEAIFGQTPKIDPVRFDSPNAEFPIVRGSEARIADVLEPSKDWCARPRVACAGATFDERIPLEDELSDNSNGVEDSWKHYLDLASAAATEADTLGTDYINSAIGKDQNQVSNDDKRQQQIEQANSQLQQLQALCGTNIDVNTLLTAFPKDSNGNLLTTTGTCTSDANCTQPGYSCTGITASAGGGSGGRCTFDIDKFLSLNLAGFASTSDAQRLQDCLGAGGITPYVSLGDNSLCFWQQQDNANLLCRVPDPNNSGDTPMLINAPPSKCPIEKPKDQTCAEALGMDLPPLTDLKESATLGYFTMTNDGVSGGADNNAFDSLKTLTPKIWMDTDTTVHDKILSANILDPVALYSITSGIDWEARGGDFGAITFNGDAIYETGSLAGGPVTSTPPPDAGMTAPADQVPWPCGTKDIPWTGENVGSYDCHTFDGRRAATNELLQITLAIKLMTAFPKLADADGNNVKVPFNSMSHGFQKDLCGTCTSAQSIQLPGPGAISVLKEGCDKGTLIIDPIDGSDTDCIAPDSINVPKITDYQGGPMASTFVPFQTVVGSALSGLSKTARTNYGAPLSWVTNYLTGKAQTSMYLSAGGVQGREVMLALGVMAKAATSGSRTAISLTAPPKITSIEDLGYASQYMQRVADQIQNSVGSIVFANMPTAVADALRKESANGSYPQFGGDMAVQVANARGAMLRIRENGPLIANEVAQMGSEIDSLRLIAQKSTIHQKIAHLQFVSTMGDRIAQCGTAIANAVQVGGDLLNNAKSFGVAGTAAAAGAAITCVNSVAQIGISKDIAGLQGQDAELDKELAVADFDAKFSSHATALQSLGLHLAEAEEDLDAALATIETKRVQARDTLRAAIMAASYQSQNQAQLTNALGNLADGKQIRYQTALTNAKRLSFLAKRAIEQRLGVRLADMRDDYPLVEAPRNWESTVCQFTGVDYSKLAENNPNAPQSFANGFIGDYVRKLGNFVESYRLQKNFHEGTDTAVISLRDDLMGVRVPCKVDGPNLLFNAGQLAEGIQPGWGREGCPSQLVGGVPQPTPDCINVNPLLTAAGAPDSPLFAADSEAKTNGYELVFGAPSTSTSAIVQSVPLVAGRYRFTWYTKQTGSNGGAGAGVVRDLVACSGGSTANCIIEDGVDTIVSNGWHRRFMVFRLVQDQTVRVGFTKPAGSGQVSVSAPMLEKLLDVDADQDLTPFVNTTDVLAIDQPGCEDIEGNVFRSKHWDRGCVKLCADGLADNCDTAAKEYCYWETQFGFSQRDIQVGKVFNFSGFARGNFNYRIDSLGLNFVGTSTRDCSGSSSPETCYGGGYIPFSLSHTGPFYVRNFDGADVEAMIFDGNIEHARGLALERYLTNPLSSADQSLIQQLERREFSGRPLDGNFVLRVWDEDGVNFQALQDVQIVLNYRYWTKFN